MINHYFIYDGVPSTDFGTFLASSNLFDAPEKDVERKQVPGRNGEILIPNNRYHNFELTATAVIPHRLINNVENLKAFLMSRNGYCRYEESYHPDKYRMACFIKSFEMGAMNKHQGVVDLHFICKPQQFLKAGEISKTYSKAGEIWNPTYFEAQPMIRAYGYGHIYIGDYEIQIAQSTLPYVDIDCERMDVYYKTTNCNNMIAFGNDFPKLAHGETSISFDNTISKIDITPRWWTI